MNATINAVAKRYRFTNKERDDETGFYYIGARYYAPWLARWCAADPINSEFYNHTHGQPGRNTERQYLELTASGYGYCYANPVRFTDPTGEQALPDDNYIQPVLSSIPNTAATLNSQEGMRQWADKDAGDRMYKQGKYQDILVQGPNGALMGPKNIVAPELAVLNWQHTIEVGENIAGGIGGAIGYKVGGDKGAAIGAQFDNISLGLFYNRQVEPVVNADIRGRSKGGREFIYNNLWSLPSVLRGEVVEDIQGGNLPKSYPVIDRFDNNVATSIKSLYLPSPTYQRLSALKSTLTTYVDKLANFSGYRSNISPILPTDISKRVLEVIIPTGSATSGQQQVMNDIIRYGSQKPQNVQVQFIEMR